MQNLSLVCELSGKAAPVLAQRISIAKAMSVINSKDDGAHLFESFTNGGKDYEIYYHIKGGKLTPKVTLSTKS